MNQQARGTGPTFPVQNLTVEQVGYKNGIIRELCARGYSAEGALAAYEERADDYMRCLRNKFPPAKAVTSVIGSWAKPSVKA